MKKLLAAVSLLVISGSVYAQTSHELQITALNFLTGPGGLEHCNVENKIFKFSSSDKSREVLICENSRVKVSATSNEGVVTFHATNVLDRIELTANDYSSSQLELGKTQGMIRYYPKNNYGFTYVMAEEVTGIDKTWLAQMNNLVDQAASLQAEIVRAQQRGETAPAETVKALNDIEQKLVELTKEKQELK
jgi:hypothetical protein